MLHAQTAWPSKAWDAAANLSAALPLGADELSGLYWNQLTSMLYCVGDGGVFNILQYDSTSLQYTLICSTLSIDNPEGITKVDDSANEFYTIDETSYQICKYTYDTNYKNITKSNSWYLLQAPSPMTDTGNDGPEGIAFVPDKYLQKIGFVSSLTGKVYTSTKGMGGLFFVAHQHGGYVWVFDVNPATNNDFAFVGKYLTNRYESCETSFDPSTGLLYVLHNADDNYLEVCDLTTTKIGNEYKLTMLKEYFIPNPSGKANVEGFAISPKFPERESLGVWLCRDVKKNPDISDQLRWFYPYAADGNELQTKLEERVANSDQKFQAFVNHKTLTIYEHAKSENLYNTEIYSVQGKLIKISSHKTFPFKLSIQNIPSGLYYIRINKNNTTQAATLKIVI